MLSSNLKLSIAMRKGYNNKILVSNTGMKIGLNNDLNNNRKKLLVITLDVSKAVMPEIRHDPVETKKLHNLEILTQKHNNVKLAITLLIVGTGLIAFRFRYKINGIIIIHNRWCRSECMSL